MHISIEWVYETDACKWVQQMGRWRHWRNAVCGWSIIYVCEQGMGVCVITYDVCEMDMFDRVQWGIMCEC